MLSQGNRAMSQLFGLQFDNDIPVIDIHYKSIRVAKLRKPCFRVPNIPVQTEFNAKWPFKVIQMCFGIIGKAITH